jgi:hypothetical protein
MLSDFDRADRIGELHGNVKTRPFAELLIDCEEDRTLRAVLVGMLREMSIRAARRRAGCHDPSEDAAAGSCADVPKGRTNRAIH